MYPKFLNSFQVGATPNVQAELPVPVLGLPDYAKVAMLVAVIVQPVKNTGGGALAITKAIAEDIFQKVASTFRLELGGKKKEVIDDGNSFSDMRMMLNVLNDEDFLFNGVPLDKYVDGTINIGAGLTTSIEMAFVRSFLVDQEGERQDDGCPSAQQLAEMKFAFKPGAYVTANLVQDGNASVQVFAYFEDGESKGGYANVYRLATNDNAGADHAGPAGGGQLLALWDANDPAATTALKDLTLKRNADLAIIDNIPATRVATDIQLRTQDSRRDISGKVTPIYILPRNSKRSQIPTSDSFTLHQSANATKTFKSRWLYRPTVSEQYVQAYVAPNTPPDAKVIVTPALKGEDVPGNVAAVSSLSFVPLSDAKADLHDGLIHDGTGGLKLHASPIQNAVTQKLSSPEQAPLVAQAIKERAKSVPAGRSPVRAGIGIRQVELAQTASHGDIVSRVMGFFRRS